MPVDKVRDGDGGGKWTPGPWEACERGDYGDYDGDCIVILGDNNRRRIAIVLGTDEEAHLIVAAPALARELAAATAWMIERQSDEYGPRENWAGRERIEAQEAALALAEGGQS